MSVKAVSGQLSASEKRRKHELDSLLLWLTADRFRCAIHGKRQTRCEREASERTLGKACGLWLSPGCLIIRGVNYQKLGFLLWGLVGQGAAGSRWHLPPPCRVISPERSPANWLARAGLCQRFEQDLQRHTASKGRERGPLAWHRQMAGADVTIPGYGTGVIAGVGGASRGAAGPTWVIATRITNHGTRPSQSTS